MEYKKLNNLLKRYLTGEWTLEERKRIEQWYRQLDIRQEGFSEAQMKEDLLQIRDRLPTPSVRRMSVWLRRAAAVLVFGLLSAGIYYYAVQYGWWTEKQEMSDASNQDIAPGGNKAILKLANGTEIALDERPDGEIVRDGGHAIYKNADGKLTYRQHDEEKSDALPDEPIFNSIRTPRGGQYHVVLPDSSKVWLNAESTLTYAIGKSMNERLVKLEGEAYFEVAKDNSRPFRVETKGLVAVVLGTQFNINSYPDEPDVKTTLLEGSLNVAETLNHESIILIPGQQAALDSDSRLSVKSVNVAEVTAWKNGKFCFNQSDIGTVMRQFARWYDVDVVFEGEMPDVVLSGEIYRNTNASKVLEILSFYNLNCRIEITDDGVRQIVFR